MRKSTCFILIVFSAFVLFNACATANSATLAEKYWLEKINSEFDLSINEVTKYKGSNQEWLDFYCKLDTLFPKESVTVQPNDLYKIANKFDSTIDDAYQAYIHGRKYFKNPE